MKTNEQYILRNVAGENVLIPIGEVSQHFNGMIHLTGTAAFIWEQVDRADSLEAIIQRLQEVYDVDEETARRDVYGFLGELYKRGMVSGIPELEDF